MTSDRQGKGPAGRPFPGLARIDLGEIPYAEAAGAMRRQVAECQSGAAGDRLFLLSHPPVVTYGPRTPPGDLPPATTGLDVVEVDRGGQATYHGPGQLVGYLIANVRERGPADVVRWLEHSIINALATLGFPAVRRPTLPGGPSMVGVWTPDNRKIASIGMRIRSGVTSHGFSVNIDPDMTVFASFVSCGLTDPVTSLAVLAGERGQPTPSEDAVREALAAALGAT